MNEVTMKNLFLSIFEDLRALIFRLENTNIFVFQAFFGFSNFLDHFCFFFHIPAVGSFSFTLHFK